MIPARHRLLGDVHAKRVWTVDDAWFEMGVLHHVDAVRSPCTNLAELHAAANEVSSSVLLSDEVRLNAKVLAEIAANCKTHGLGLLVCNFEYFEENFVYANQPGNAVLLDVMYADHPRHLGGDPETYGVELLADLLDGQPFRGHLFFVTVAGRRAAGLIATRTMAGGYALGDRSKWWPLLSHFSIAKRSARGSPVLAFESPEALETFFSHFQRHIPPRERVVTHDVRFVLLIPVAALLGRLDREVADGAKGKEANTRFLIPLMKEFGSAARLKDLDLAGAHKGRFAEAVAAEVAANRESWKDASADYVIPGDQEAIVRCLTGPKCVKGAKGLRERFTEFIGSWNTECVRIKNGRQPSYRYLTLEDWCRNEVADALKAYTAPLVEEFGGATQFDFARGVWTGNAGRAVEDMLIVLELLTRRSAFSRHHVVKWVVKPLIARAGEEAVILQELPVEAYTYRKGDPELTSGGA